MRWNTIRLFFCLLAVTFFGNRLYAESPPQEIRIQLATDSPLAAIYLSKIHCQDGSISSSYLQEIDSVLAYDFNYNGKTKVLAKSPNKETLLSTPHNTTELRSIGAPYAVAFTVKDKKLSATAYDLLSSSAKQISDIPLSGSIAQDRRKIHALSDAIHKVLFHQEGVANSRILFSCQYKNPKAEGTAWLSEIWECDWDGHNARPITKENTYCITPVLLPKDAHFQKDLFLYVSYRTGQPKIYISSIGEAKGSKVVDIRGNQLLPAISKQRDQLAFICDASGRADLFIQPIQSGNGLTGTPKQIFSYPRSTQASPTFSPDGSSLAFVSDKDGATRIYTISTKASQKRPNARLITKRNKENSCPSWSPDGTKLAYSAKTDGIRQIWIYDFATEEEQQLTMGPGNKENPCWAPDSTHIVFNSTDGTSSDLYIVNMNQPDAVKITQGPGKKHYPTWGIR